MMNKKMLLIFSVIICILICSCSAKQNQLTTLMQDNNYVIVDVRTKEEYKESHIKDAINIPYDEINEDTELDKNKLIMVYCKSGTRSGIAYETLTNLGYNVYDLGAYQNLDLEKVSE